MVSVPKGSTFISTFPKFKVCMKKLFPFLFFCFFTTLVVAQSNSGKLKYVENEAVKNLPYQPTDVNITFYIFQKVNSNMRLEEFTKPIYRIIANGLSGV